MRVRGTTVGRTPFTDAVRVDGGNGRVEIVHPDYLPYSTELQLPRGAAAVVVASLQARATHGRLVVTARVVGGQVSVDREARGSTPLEIDLLAGTHVVTWSKGDGSRDERVVTVTAGGTTGAEMNSAPPPSLLGKWWFWAAVGGAAAIGVGAVVLATSSTSAAVGTAQPGQISAGLRF